MHRLAIAAVAGLAATLPAAAAPVFTITEIYAGITGEDGTPDWFELTNTGDMPGSTAGFYWDDESADPTEDAALTAFDLAVGESAVFVRNADADDFADFAAIWGTGMKVGLADGGGGLSQNGDAVFVFDSNLPGANVVASASFGSGFANTGTTIVFGTSAVPGLAMLGVGGAYESAAFFNDNIGGPDETTTLIGSPGTSRFDDPMTPIPLPATALLLLAGLGGLGLARRH